jgi:3-oxoacyl-[acyl-carrier-protein] synthase-3
MLPVKIAGLGYYLPARRVTNAELEVELGIPPGWVERRAGVCERRYAASGETAVGMAGSAARSALKSAGVKADHLDAIIGASSGPQQLIPCTAALVQREIGAPDGGSACFDVGATCLSFVVALHTAAHLIAAGVYRSILIFSTEITAHSLNPQEPESAALLGDAAAAAVVTRTPPGEPSAVWHGQFSTFSSGADLTHFLGGGSLHHPNDPATTAEMNLFHMNGRAIFKQAACLLGPFLDRFFGILGWDRTQIEAVVPHQASRHGIELAARLGFRSDQLIVNLPLRGNCISASIPLALAEAVEAGRVQRGDRVLLVGTGAGLTLGALALTY